MEHLSILINWREWFLTEGWLSNSYLLCLSFVFIVYVLIETNNKPKRCLLTYTVAFRSSVDNDHEEDRQSFQGVIDCGILCYHVVILKKERALNYHFLPGSYTQGPDQWFFNEIRCSTHCHHLIPTNQRQEWTILLPSWAGRAFWIV